MTEVERLLDRLFSLRNFHVGPVPLTEDELREAIERATERSDVAARMPPASFDIT